MNKSQLLVKHTFDFIGALIGTLVTFPLILLLALLIFVETRNNGIYSDIRIGRYGKPFRMYKIRSMRRVSGIATTVTTDRDPRISTFGRIIRKTKLDELPQLWNVLIGNMSFVGPRPDVPGFADKLVGDDRIILSVRPGITGVASLAFRDEERILAAQENPEQYNREVIWPEKIRLNKAYVADYSFFKDLVLIWRTVFHRR